MKRVLVISLWLLVVGLGLASGVLRQASTLYRCKTQDAQPTTHDPYYQQLYKDLLYSSVKITAGIGIGSGVVIATTDSHRLTQIYILTAAHVVGDYSEVTVTFYSYRRDAEVAEKIEASVVITDTYKDLALLRVLSASAVKSARLAPRDYTPYLFTPVYAVGCSLGLPPRPSSGIITAIPLGELSASAVNWEISAPIAPGNSGGGVFLKDTHELIGIAVWVRGYRKQLITTMAGIVPLQDIYEFLDEARSRNQLMCLSRFRYTHRDKRL